MAITTYEETVKAKASTFGFRYHALMDQWVSESGACIPATIMDTDKLLSLMAQSAKLSAEQEKEIRLPPGSRPPKPPPFDHMADAMAYAAAAQPRGTGKPVFPGKRSPYEKLAVRLDIEPGSTFPFEHCHIVETSTEYHVLIVKNDQAVLLHDDKNLFPSDTLIGKIRLLQ